MRESSPAVPLPADRIYTAVAVVLLLLAAMFAVRGGASDGAATDGIPRITVEAPASAQPLVVIFDPGTELRAGPAGWGAEGRHVHVRVGTTELMGGPADVQPVGGGRYRWTLPRLPAGEHTVQVFWSDESHRPLRTGASQPLQVLLP